MKTFTGLFGASLVSTQMTTSSNVVDMIEFFPIKSSTTGTTLTNTATMFVGLETGALPYFVPTGGSLTLNYASNRERQNTQNFFLRGGANGDGYYVISYP